MLRQGLNSNPFILLEDTNAGVEKCGRSFAPRDQKLGVRE